MFENVNAIFVLKFGATAVSTTQHNDTLHNGT
jgi:hypothetical protein